MGQVGWNFIAQGTGYSSHTRDRLQSHTRDRLQGHIRDRLQRPITAIADGNGGGGFEGVVLIQKRARWRLEFRGTGS
jgi:hypothetical protein